VDQKLFVYGSLVPSELAYGLIEDLIGGQQAACITGANIFVRDAFPLITIDKEKFGHSIVNGTLLTPKLNKWEELILIVEQYENSQYSLIEGIEVETSDGTELCSVFVAAHPARLDDEPLGGSWSSARHPMFCQAFAEIGIQISQLDDQFDKNDRSIAEFGRPYWTKIIRAEGLYLVQFSVLEELVRLKYSHSKDGLTASSGFARLADESLWIEATSNAVIPSFSVYVNDNKSKIEKTGTPKKNMRAWYAVRNNLAHRGKTSSGDYEKVMSALKGMHSVMEIYFQLLFPEIRESWENYLID